MTKPYYAPMWSKSEATWEEPPKLEFFEREGEGCIYREEFLGLGRKMG